MKKTLNDLKQMKTKGEKISWITASDFPTATAAERGGVDMILGGDSCFMTQYGYPDTKNATMPIMEFVTAAIRRGAPNTFICGDMPIGSYDNEGLAVLNAILFQHVGADMVKLEGRKPEAVKFISKEGIPVCGHLGLIPQTSNGFKVYGKTLESFESLVEDALCLQDAGAEMILLEAVPEKVAWAIAKNLDILVLGIGAGRYLDGNLIIQNDLLGYYPSFRPTFVKCVIPDVIQKLQANIFNMNDDELQDYGKTDPGADGFLFLATEANRLYSRMVKEGTFPEPRHNYKIKPEELDILRTSKYWRE